MSGALDYNCNGLPPFFYFACTCVWFTIDSVVFKLIRDNFRIIRDFFRLMHGDRKWVFLLFLGSGLAHIATLIAPIYASNIIYEVTKGNANAAYFNIVLLAIMEIV